MSESRPAEILPSRPRPAQMGLVTGWLVAPLLTSPGAALVGTAGAPSLTLHTAAVVVAVALVVALASAVIPAMRAAHSSTVDALADAARPPKRRGWLIRFSSRLSVPALFGLRLVARHASSVIRGLGATPRQVRTGLADAQVFSALPGVVLGVPLGLALFDRAAGVWAVPSALWLVATVLGTLFVVTGLTTVPARIATRHSVAELLQLETV